MTLTHQSLGDPHCQWRLSYLDDCGDRCRLTVLPGGPRLPGCRGMGTHGRCGDPGADGIGTCRVPRVYPPDDALGLPLSRADAIVVAGLDALLYVHGRRLE